MLVLPKPPPVRLAAERTRVIVLREGAPAGEIREVRQEPWLKTYVVRCDDGATLYASAHELAREDDPRREPLGPPVEY